MGLYDAAKDAVKIAQKLDNVELVQKLLDVQQQALDMQEKQHSLNNKIEEQEAEIRRLKKEFTEIDSKLKQKESLKFEDESYWSTDKDGKRTEGPFCMSCFDVHGRKQRLSKGDSGYYHCPACKNSFLVNKQEHEADIARSKNRNESRYRSFFSMDDQF